MKLDGKHGSLLALPSPEFVAQASMLTAKVGEHLPARLTFFDGVSTPRRASSLASSSAICWLAAARAPGSAICANAARRPANRTTTTATLLPCNDRNPASAAAKA